jgi:hemolysin III
MRPGRWHRHRVSLEELANTVTHGIGLVLSVGGFVALLFLAVRRGSLWPIVSCAIYGSTLVCLYAASTLCHGVPWPRLRRAFLIFDHCAIYLLIAGTYTPFLLVNLRGAEGWSLFGVMWGLAAAGVLFQLRFVGHFPMASTSLYVLMGWLGVVAIKPMLAHVPSDSLVWLLAGGLAYTVGVIFYAWKRLPYHHMIWHMFVMAGSALHYVAILHCVFVTDKA